jgi:glyoxylate utilization-related uncharacterized protein
MQLPSHTRSSYRRDYLPQTPDTFIRAAFPGLSRATAIVHAAPAMGARFTAYTVELETGGTPEMFSGRERGLTPQPIEGDPALEVRSLTPAHFAYHFIWMAPYCPQ